MIKLFELFNNKQKNTIREDDRVLCVEDCWYYFRKSFEKDKIYKVVEVTIGDKTNSIIYVTVASDKINSEVCNFTNDGSDFSNKIYTEIFRFDGKHDPQFRDFHKYFKKL